MAAVLAREQLHHRAGFAVRAHAQDHPFVGPLHDQGFSARFSPPKGAVATVHAGRGCVCCTTATPHATLLTWREAARARRHATVLRASARKSNIEALQAAFSDFPCLPAHGVGHTAVRGHARGHPPCHAADVGHRGRLLPQPVRPACRRARAHAVWTESVLHQQLKLHVFRACINAFSMIAFFIGLSIDPDCARHGALVHRAVVCRAVQRAVPGRGVSLAALVRDLPRLLRRARHPAAGLQAIDLGSLLILFSSVLWSVAMIDIKLLGRT